MAKSLKIILIVVASLVALFTIITLLAGPIARGYLNRHGQQLIGREVEVDHVGVNLYSGHLNICKFKVYEDNPQDLFLQIDTLDASLRLRSLLSHAIYLRHLTLSGLDINVVQDGKNFNFNSILDRFKKDDEDDDAADTNAKPWEITLLNIRLSHWRACYKDLAVGGEWNVNDLSIEVPGVFLKGDQNTDAGISLKLTDGGELITNLAYNIEKGDFSVDLDLVGFNLKNIEAYLTHTMNLSKVEGLLDADLKAVGNLSHLMDMKLTGLIKASDIDCRDQYQELLSCHSIEVDLDEVIIAKNQYHVRSIGIEEVSSRYDRYQNGNNFSRLAKPSKKEAEQKEADPQDEQSADNTAVSPLSVKINKFKLTHGRVTYADHTLPDPFTFPITDITLEINDLMFGPRYHVDNKASLRARLPHAGEAVIEWKGSLDDIKRNQHLRLDIKNLQLAQLSPYTVAYLGQPFTDGTFSFISTNSITNSILDGQNLIDIYKPEVGPRRKDVDSTLHLPLKLALYVLKDKNDKVRLEVPVKGNIDSPEFSYMQLVWQTLRNLLVKVATTPMRSLANVMGMGNSNLEFMEVDADQQQFSSEQYYVMEQLASLAQQDSQIVLVMDHQLKQVDSLNVLKADKLNKEVLDHMTKQLHVPAQQLRITTNDSKHNKNGYAISSQFGVGE